LHQRLDEWVGRGDIVINPLPALTLADYLVFLPGSSDLWIDTAILRGEYVEGEFSIFVLPRYSDRDNLPAINDDSTCLQDLPQDVRDLQKHRSMMSPQTTIY
jgi:hypothetical protein